MPDDAYLDEARRILVEEGVITPSNGPDHERDDPGRTVPNLPDELPPPGYEGGDVVPIGAARGQREPDGALHGAMKKMACELADIDAVLAELRERTTWAPVDLAAIAAGILDGTVSVPTPDIGPIAGSDLGLFYRGRVNGLYGKGGDGKTWVALVAGAERLMTGAVVWWIDLEDSEHGIAARLVDLGAGFAHLARFRYFRPEGPFNSTERALLCRLAELEQPALVVIDSAGESIAAHGLKPNADEEVARWFQHVAKPLAETGAAVIAVDHMPHDTEGRIAPIGSTRKYNAVNGAAYLVKVLAEFGRDRVGRSSLTCVKDRHGHHERRKVVAEFTLDATSEPYGSTIARPTSTAVADSDPLADEKPAVRRVRDALDRADEPTTVRSLGDLVARDGKTGTGLQKRTLQDALNRLRDLGLAVVVDTDDNGANRWQKVDVVGSALSVHAHLHAHLQGTHDPSAEEP